MTDKTLTMRDLVALETVANAAQGNKRVRWLTDSGDVEEGTARSIGDAFGYFLRSDEDVRSGYLRITSVTGFEYFIPVRRLMEMVHDGEFSVGAR